MAISQRGAATQSYFTGTASPVVTAPSGVVAGDLCLVWFVTNTNANCADSAGGFTRISAEVDVSSDLTVCWYYRIATASETSWTFTSVFDATEVGMAVCVAYSATKGFTSGLVIHKNSTLTASTSSATSLSGPSVTPTVDNCLILQFAGADPGTGTYAGTPDTSPVGSERYDSKDSNGSNEAYTFIQSYQQTTAGALALDVTGLTSDYYGYGQLAIRENDVAQAAPPAGPMTLAGLAPTILLSLALLPGTGALSLAGPNPTVDTPTNYIVQPLAGSLTWTGSSMVGRSERLPQAGALGLTGLAPTTDVQASSNVTATPSAGSLSLVGEAPTRKVSVPGANKVLVGEGYTDGSTRQIVRTTGGLIYVTAPNCNEYPDFTPTGLAQTIRVHKADDTSVPPSGFTRKDSANEPAAAVGCACAIDASNNIHIVWSARSSLSLTRYLRYAVFSTSTDTWGSVTTILSNLDYDDIGQGDENAAIALDADGKAHVVFLTTVGSGVIGDRRVYYTHNVSGSWAAAVQVDSDISYASNYKAWHPSIEFDDHGRMIVIWVKGAWNADTNTGTVYVRTKETGGSWNSSVSVVASITPGIDECVSLIVTKDGRYHLGCSGAKDGNGFQPVYYFYSDNHGASWSSNHPSGVNTHNVTISLGPWGRLRLWQHAGYGVNPVNVYYIEGDGGSAAWDSQALWCTGEYDCSISARWSQYHYHDDTKSDIAFWDQNYPNDLYVASEIIASRDSTPAPVAGTLALAGTSPTILCNTVALPSDGGLSLSGLAPTVGVRSVVEPSVGTIAVAGEAPVLAFQTVVAPAAGAVAASGLAPAAVYAGVSVPSAGGLSLAGLAPSVTVALTAMPATGPMTIVGIAPTVIVNPAALPGAGGLSLVGLAPEIIRRVVVEPVAGPLTWDGPAPTAPVLSGVIESPPDGTLALSGLAPIITVRLVVFPSAGSCLTSGYAPSAVQQVVASPGAGDVSVVGVAPSAPVTSGNIETPVAGALSMSGLAPVLVVHLLCAPATGSLVIAGQTPIPSSPTLEEPSPGVLVLAGPAPTARITTRVVVPVPTPTPTPGADTVPVPTATPTPGAGVLPIPTPTPTSACPVPVPTPTPLPEAP